MWLGDLKYCLERLRVVLLVVLLVVLCGKFVVALRKEARARAADDHLNGIR